MAVRKVSSCRLHPKISRKKPEGLAWLKGMQEGEERNGGSHEGNMWEG